MPASGEPWTWPFIAPPSQVVMPFPVKSSSHGKVPPPVPGHVHVLIHFPPKSPKVDAAGLVILVVKPNQGPAGETFWHAPSISVALTLSVQVTVAPPPFGPACIVQEPPRPRGPMPALRAPAVCVAVSTAALPEAPGGSLSVKASTLPVRIASRVKEGDVMLSESGPRVIVVRTPAPPISVVVRFQVPMRLPASGPGEMPADASGLPASGPGEAPADASGLPASGPGELPADASGLPEPALLQWAENAPQRPHTNTARFLIFNVPPSPIPDRAERAMALQPNCTAIARTPSTSPRNGSVTTSSPPAPAITWSGRRCSSRGWHCVASGASFP